MKQKTYLIIVTIIFSGVSFFHLLRLALKWKAIIGTWTIPLWISYIAFVIPAFLAYSGFKLSKKNR